MPGSPINSLATREECLEECENTVSCEAIAWSDDGFACHLKTPGSELTTEKAGTHFRRLCTVLQVCVACPAPDHELSSDECQ